MVVVAIISVLIGAVGISLSRVQTQRRDGQRITDVLAIAKAVDQYAELNRGTYPPHDAGSTCSTACWSAIRPYADKGAKPNDPSSLSIFYGYRNCVANAPAGICLGANGLAAYKYYISTCLEGTPDKELAKQLVKGATVGKCTTYYVLGPPV